jgi:hypothetical protein
VKLAKGVQDERSQTPHLTSPLKEGRGIGLAHKKTSCPGRVAISGSTACAHAPLKPRIGCGASHRQALHSDGGPGSLRVREFNVFYFPPPTWGGWAKRQLRSGGGQRQRFMISPHPSGSRTPSPSRGGTGVCGSEPVEHHYSPNPQSPSAPQAPERGRGFAPPERRRL